MRSPPCTNAALGDDGRISTTVSPRGSSGRSAAIVTPSRRCVSARCIQSTSVSCSAKMIFSTGTILDTLNV